MMRRSRGRRRRCEAAVDAIPSVLLAGGMGAEVFGEEGKDVALDAVGDFADVRAGIDFEFVIDCVVVHGFVKCLGIEAEAVLVSDVEEDAAILAETSDILIKKCERGVGG